MSEHEIQLDPKDVDRLRRINVNLREAQEIWDRSMGLIIFDYIENIKSPNPKISIKAMDFDTGKMSLVVNEPIPTAHQDKGGVS